MMNVNAEMLEALEPSAAVQGVSDTVAERLKVARGHLINVEKHGNAEANAVLVIRNVLSELEVAIASSRASLAKQVSEMREELDVRVSDLVMLRKAIEASDPKAELLIRIDDMLRETRAALKEKA